MFDWIKSFVENRVVSLAIGYLVAKVGALGLEAHGITIDPTTLKMSLFSAYQAFAHVVETKTVGTKWEWVGKVL